MTTLPHQFTEDKAVSPRSTAQIKNHTSFQLFWNHQATAKIPADSFSVHYCNKSGKTKVLRHNLLLLLYLLQTSGWTSFRAFLQKIKVAVIFTDIVRNDY